MTVERYFEVHGEAREEYLGSLNPEHLLQLGIDLYNAGHYWNAHEAWEEVWLESVRDLRAFYQGLIQVTAAFVHVTRNEYPGSVKLLEAGIEKLEKYPAVFLGVRLSALIEGAQKAHDRLIELGERNLTEFDRSSIPRIETTGGAKDANPDE
jgi:uncharacterized protein